MQMYVLSCMCMHACVCMCIYMGVYIDIYIHMYISVFLHALAEDWADDAGLSSADMAHALVRRCTGFACAKL